jgi:SAM-dependent methyltransferase
MKNQLKSVAREVIRSYELWKYKGDNVFCPVCQQSFSNFAYYGPRPKAKCPNCGAVERHRLMWKYMNEKTNFKEWNMDTHVLHIAPEAVFHKVFSALPIHYVPVDLFPEDYYFKEGVKVQKADITAIPFEDNSFDVIICSHVLEHIPDDALAMREMYRVMKHGGWGIFQVPIDYSLQETYEDFTITSMEGRKKAFGQEYHVRWYGNDYKDRLAKAGFKVNVDRYIETFSDEDMEKYGFEANELIYYCEKK